MTQPGTALEPADVAGFTYSEHLLIFSWRRIATGQANCPLMAREFAHTFGEDANEVFLTFCTFLKALAFASRRHLTVGTPGCIAVTADERQVLTLLAAAQADAPVLFDAHLRWLTAREQRHILAIASGALATAFKMNGLALALPAIETPIIRRRKLAVA